MGMLRKNIFLACFDITSSHLSVSCRKNAVLRQPDFFIRIINPFRLIIYVYALALLITYHGRYNRMRHSFCTLRWDSVLNAKNMRSSKKTLKYKDNLLPP